MKRTVVNMVLQESAMANRPIKALTMNFRLQIATGANRVLQESATNIRTIKAPTSMNRPTHVTTLIRAIAPPHETRRYEGLPESQMKN